MRLELKTFLSDRLLVQHAEPLPATEAGFTKDLEAALVAGCHAIEAPIPLWMSRNTKEFAAFHQTVFFDEQFLEKTRFDRLQIRLLQE